MELGYRSYAIFFLTALLTRESIRVQLDQPLRSLQFPIDLNSDRSDRIQHQSPSFVDDSIQSPWSSNSKEKDRKSLINLKHPDRSLGNEKIGLEGIESGLENWDGNRQSEMRSMNSSLNFRTSRRRTLSSSAVSFETFRFKEFQATSSLPTSMHKPESVNSSMKNKKSSSIRRLPSIDSSPTSTTSPSQTPTQTSDPG